MTNTHDNSKAVEGDEDYKLGVIYFNTSDPRIVVPKKHGIGWTLNVGHPVGQLGLALAVGAVIVPMVMRKKSRTDTVKSHLKDLKDLKKLKKMVKM